MTPLIMAGHLKQPDIQVQLLDAGALVDVQDTMNRTALQHAVLAENMAGIEVLLDHQAEIDDESLHLAAKLLRLPIVKLLLNRGALAMSRGAASCEGRIPLAELCRNAELRGNPPQLRKTIKHLCTATKDLRVCTADGKSLIYQALDNDCAHKMTTALFASCISLEGELNDEYNIYSRGSRRYSPTAYVRHFKCLEPLGYRCLDFSQQCCNHDTCPAPHLEKLLRSYHCKDRFWDDQAGTNQPKGFCNPPQAITIAIKEVEARRLASERLARANAEENARRERIAAKRKAETEQMERERDAAAEAERKRADTAAAAERQRKRQHAEEEARAIEWRAAAERRAIEAVTNAEIEQKRLTAAVEADEEEARHRRERALRQEEMALEAENDRQKNRILKERSNIQVDQKKRESDYQKQVMKEERALLGDKRRLVDSGTRMLKEAAISGVSKQSMGRILGEIEDA